MLYHMALDKMLFSVQKYWYFSYFSRKTCYGYSLEAPHRGASNEYPQHMFLWKENYLPDSHLSRPMLSGAMINIVDPDWWYFRSSMSTQFNCLGIPSVQKFRVTMVILYSISCHATVLSCLLQGSWSTNITRSGRPVETETDRPLGSSSQ